MRPVVLHAKARETIREFPRDVRDRLGRALFLLQMGEQPSLPLSRPMPTVAPGVAEIRLHDSHGRYRVFYVAATDRGVLVFHAFVKKTQRTPPSEIRLAQKRLKEMLDE